MNAGTQFNYAVWTPNSQVLLANVSWDSNYRDIVNFDSQAALDAYLQRPGQIEFTHNSLAKIDEPIRVPLGFSSVCASNYVRVRNPANHADGDTTFYYFIKDVRYIAPETTEIVVQLDVWQTFGRRATFGRCYLERGHLGIANEKQMNNGGLDYLDVPEGLDIGSEYTTVAISEHTIAQTQGNKSYDVIMASTVEIQNDNGTEDDPVLKSATGSDFEELPNGCALYWFESYAQFRIFMGGLSGSPWITQGVISVTAVPALGIDKSKCEAIKIPQSSATAYRLPSGGRLPESVLTIMSDFRERVGIPSRYAGLQKFKCYPYSVIELTTYSGTPLILKPQNVATNDLQVMERIHVVPPNPRIVYYPRFYNSAQGVDNDRMGEYLNMTTGIFDMPTFSVTNNSYMSFMAANRNTIAYQHSSADWSQQRALQGNQVAQQNSYAGLSNMVDQNAIGNQRLQNMNNINNDANVMRSLQGAGNAIATMNPMGMATGGFNTAMSAMTNNMVNNRTTGVMTAANSASMAANFQTGKQITDSNKTYADFAAQGDYANAIAGINAKVQDAKLMQPTVSGQIGGDAFNLATQGWTLTAKVKRITNGAVATIGEFWLRYGYCVNRFIVPPKNLQCMSEFTYWKMRETYIQGFMPETFKQTIRGIFESCVTVLRNPNNVGTIDSASNKPISGMSY